MGYLIDTNILSEIRKRDRANYGVREWFAQANDEDLFLSVLTLGEIRRGIEGIRRRDAASAAHLDQWFATVQARAGGARPAHHACYSRLLGANSAIMVEQIG